MIPLDPELDDLKGGSLLLRLLARRRERPAHAREEQLLDRAEPKSKATKTAAEQMDLPFGE